MADELDNIDIGEFYSSDKLKNTGLINSVAISKLYALNLVDLNAQDPGVINDGPDDDSLVYEVVSLDSLPLGSVQIQTIGKDGESEDVSQGFGLGIRQHNDVMLSYGYSRFTRDEKTLTSGDFMVIRLNVGDVDQHHAEDRVVTSSEGSLRFYVYDVTDNTGLFPASPTNMPIINEKGPVIETPGVDVVGEFFDYPVQGSNPFAALDPIDEIPLNSDPGGLLQADGSGIFSEVEGRHYTADRVYAVVVEKIGTGSTDVYYRYGWHEY